MHDNKQHINYITCNNIITMHINIYKMYSNITEN